MTAAPLTPQQTHALFDILTHYETYAEIQAFKYPDAVTSYGFPFVRETVIPAGGWKSAITTPASSAPGTPRVRTPVPPTSAAGSEKNSFEDLPEDDDESPSTSPLLQKLLTKFVLRLPGVKNLPREFWAVRVQGLLARLGDADFSESYDKGALGTRIVLATGSSGLIEMIGRGLLGGVRKRVSDEKKDQSKYDQSDAEDLARAWDDVVDGLVYGNLVDDMFDHLSKTDDLEGHSPAVKAAAQYAIVHLATFLHHILIISPEGQYLLKLLENVHNLIPYKMVKQTLRYGNAATMVNAMMRLLLAKLSVTSVTNWMGLTANADDGMNLLQRIISMVLAWDAGEFRKTAEKIVKSKDRPSDDMLQAIRQHISQDRAEHETVRKASEEHSQSIIIAIFNATNPKLTDSLTEQKHTQCLDYYSALLSARDRDNLAAVFCRQTPDLFTAMMKDLIAAYDPLIRTVHAGVDLREHLEAGQAFIDDFIKTSKPKKAETGTSTPLGSVRSMFSSEAPSPEKMASVDDYVDLLMRNRHLMYKWVHAVASKCPDVWEEMREWSKEVIVHFREVEASKGGNAGSEETQDSETKPDSESKHEGTNAGEAKAMEQHLNELFQSLPPSAQPPMVSALNSHSEYLTSLHNLSLTHLQRIIDNTTPDTNAMDGPGVYLARWQALLDSTQITPATPSGTIRRGKDVKNALTMGKTVVPGSVKARELALEQISEGIEAPNVDVVVKELGGGFKELLQGLGQR